MNGFLPSGSTRLFPVVGDPIAQVRSPGAITRILERRGIDAAVVPMHVAQADLRRLFDTLLAVRNLDGLLVTIPHKHAAVFACATLTEEAAFVGAVNLVRRTAAGWHGDNTDGRGYLNGLAQNGFAVIGKRVLLVGAGGAGSAIALEMLERGAAQVLIHDRDETRRDALIAKLAERFPGGVTRGSADPSGFDLVANATPMGMQPSDPLPVDVSRLQSSQFVACAVTKPEVPPLIAEARRRGCRTMTGAGMFDAQAEILTDFLLEEDMKTAYRGTC